MQKKRTKKRPEKTALTDRQLFVKGADVIVYMCTQISDTYQRIRLVADSKAPDEYLVPVMEDMFRSMNMLGDLMNAGDMCEAKDEWTNEIFDAMKKRFPRRRNTITGCPKE